MFLNAWLLQRTQLQSTCFEHLNTKNEKDYSHGNGSSVDASN